MIPIATGIIAIAAFGLAGVRSAGISIPGAFLARAFVERVPLRIHAAILDVAVIAGGLEMISAAVRSLL